MMPHWIEAPDRPPFRCLLTVNGDADAGPYYAPGLQFFDAVMTDHGPMAARIASTLYLSPDAFIEASQVQGSPIVAMRREDYEAEQAQAADTAAELDEARLRVAELSARCAELEGHLNPKQIADALIPLMDERFARKPGPKPKSAA